ncbi:MAG TPA: glycosyl transferase family 2 [Prolixibacteraceae bacterium]|nr:glycosyl transferase family 2 [Prolixibacteraceae bacterium]
MLPLGIIVQARTGSTRMPEKVIQPFYGQQTILDLLLEKVKKLELPMVLATTVNPLDERLCKLAYKHAVPVFRGSENDVLDRFIQAAHQFRFHKIIRVCADNPFLDLTSLQTLAESFKQSDADYLGYQLAGNKPSILTHFGFWAEAVRLDALEKAAGLTSEKVYHEHVTNFIYGNPTLFNVEFIEADPVVLSRTDIRMTLDTAEDFELQKKIFATIIKENPNFGIREIVQWLDQHPEVLEKMKAEIQKNQK